jgi:hypothetical protein
MGQIKIIADINIVKSMLKNEDHIHPRLDIISFRSLGTESEFHEVVLDSPYVKQDLKGLYQIDFEDHCYNDRDKFTTWKLTKQ